jgi:hypothetical protein
MRLKKLALLLAGPVAALGAVVPTTAAHATPGAAVCVVAGTVHLAGGVYVNPTKASSGTYHFVSVKIACAGTVAGIADVTSDGSYNNAAAPQLPTFDGAFQTTAFTTGNACGGHLAGKRAGAIVFGQMDSVNCTAGLTPGASNGIGAVALAFIPDPRTITVSGANSVINDAVLAGAAVIAATA